ncbi:hypothetical protein BLNAU_13283 [Blattamonas nauphoetae]|uniref:EF-hand domain-containing protein n=1 Tax=Blattamonas nauphoetae TaxID=2049346 RepID=A0ABQ9XNT7_9EUKA|nr:hypothetical protein BLNAU_13283 [Blattamonas nauphoetae]
MTSTRSSRSQSPSRALVHNTPYHVQSMFAIGEAFTQIEPTNFYQLCKSLDTRKTGKLFPDSLRKALAGAKIGVSSNQIDAAVKHAEVDTLGAIDYKDFMQKVGRLYEQKLNQPDLSRPPPSPGRTPRPVSPGSQQPHVKWDDNTATPNRPTKGTKILSLKNPTPIIGTPPRSKAPSSESATRNPSQKIAEQATEIKERLGGNDRCRELASALYTMDPHGKGRITRREFVIALEGVGIPVNKEDMDTISELSDAKKMARTPKRTTSREGQTPRQGDTTHLLTHKDRMLSTEVTPERRRFRRHELNDIITDDGDDVLLSYPLFLTNLSIPHQPVASPRPLTVTQTTAHLLHPDQYQKRPTTAFSQNLADPINRRPWAVYRRNASLDIIAHSDMSNDKPKPTHQTGMLPPSFAEEEYKKEEERIERMRQRRSQSASRTLYSSQRVEDLIKQTPQKEQPRPTRSQSALHKKVTEDHLWGLGSETGKVGDLLSVDGKVRVAPRNSDPKVMRSSIVFNDFVPVFNDEKRPLRERYSSHSSANVSALLNDPDPLERSVHMSPSHNKFVQQKSSVGELLKGGYPVQSKYWTVEKKLPQWPE